jgi:hypothetical protein
MCSAKMLGFPKQKCSLYYFPSGFSFNFFAALKKKIILLKVRFGQFPSVKNHGPPSPPPPLLNWRCNLHSATAASQTPSAQQVNINIPDKCMLPFIPSPQIVLLLLPVSSEVG